MRLPIALLALFCLPALADESVPEPAAMMPAPAAQPASVPLAPMTLPTPIDYGVLIVSRERLEVSTPCDIGLYLQGNLTARLYQGQSITLNLPPGQVQVRLGQLGGTSASHASSSCVARPCRSTPARCSSTASPWTRWACS